MERLVHPGQLRKMPVHGRAIDAEDARDVTKILAGVNQLGRVFRLRGPSWRTCGPTEHRAPSLVRSPVFEPISGGRHRGRGRARSNGAVHGDRRVWGNTYCCDSLLERVWTALSDADLARTIAH